MRTAESVLLGHAGNGKRLAGKTAQQNVMVRNVLGINLGDVAIDFVRVSEIGRIGFLGVGVPLARKDALAAYLFKGQPDAANSGKEIDEPEVATAARRHAEIEQALQFSGDMRRGWNLAFFPTSDLPDTEVEMHSDLLLGVLFAGSFQVVECCGGVDGGNDSAHTAGILPDFLSAFHPPENKNSISVVDLKDSPLEPEQAPV